MNMPRLYLGIDVGTGSARAGIFDDTGSLITSASSPIEMWRPEPDYVEQSSADIWNAVCTAVRRAMQAAEILPARIAGIGFAATCSLVVVGEGDAPLTVSPTGRPQQDIIVWMDHRATRQAERINAQGHAVLRYVGGTISPEMQAPKLMWLKEHLPDTWRSAVHFFDLPDWLGYRATGDTTRSLCTTVCKWTYLGHEMEPGTSETGRWDASFWRQAGLDDVVLEGFRRVGTRVRPMGMALGNGLSARSATEMGLAPATPVGVAIIDAHAGALGMLAAKLPDEESASSTLAGRLALIGGTSSCHLALSVKPVEVPGVWGPYYSALVPGRWLLEGGQSATGSLIDHVIFSHARGLEADREAKRTRRTVYDLLNERLDVLARGTPVPAALTADLHVLPYFHGNRSPRADPSLRGMVTGMRLGDTLDDLALLYLATIQSIAHGTRHIIDEMDRHGLHIATIFACGGGTKNAVFLREHADITGRPLVLSREAETVLLGAAILGATAAGIFPSLSAAMSTMNQAGRVIRPSGGATEVFHERKNLVFHRLYEDQVAYRHLMHRFNVSTSSLR